MRLPNWTDAVDVSSRTYDFNTGWRFMRGDPDGAEATDHDDAAWRNLDVPHDWSIEGPFSPSGPDAQRIAYLPTGTGWYRKSFRVPRSFDDKKLFVEFEGVFRNAEVFLNGRAIGGRAYGYSTFRLELTPHLDSRGDNILAVRVQNDTTADPFSRWYTGSGIYRNVRLVVTDPLHVAHWGTMVTTPSVSDTRATIRVETRIQNAYTSERLCVLTSRIIAPDGRIVAESVADRTISPLTEHSFTQELVVSSPRRWSPDSPDLYNLVSVVRSDDRTLDIHETRFGIRTIAFDRDRGFLLNDRPVKMKGVNLHHDAGALGAAVPAATWERRLRILKSIGCNAVRTSHNPPSPDLLDLCDRMGFLVVDEAFDRWTAPYGDTVPQWGRLDLTDMIRRDRNHPCVVMWSVGNELDTQGEPVFMDKLRELVRWTRETDATRPVTVVLAPKRFDTLEQHVDHVTTIAEQVDVIGLNYQEHLFEALHEAAPHLAIFAAESYPYYRGDGLVHDAYLPRNPWLDAEKHAYVAGTYYWAGFAYLGEAAPKWPFHGWNGALFDTTGRPYPVAELIRSFWLDEPMVAIVAKNEAIDAPLPTRPHWSWPAMADHWTLPAALHGKNIEVVTFTNCDTVELMLDGVSLGTKRLVDFPDRMITWDVPYTPGAIEARGSVGGSVVATHRLQTAGRPARLTAHADRSSITADRRDVIHIDVRVTDDVGIRVPSTDHQLHYSVTGPGKIIAVDNGDVTSSDEPYQGQTRRAYFGQGHVVIRSTGHPGTIKLTATAAGLRPVELSIPSR
ncbi:glycoside hydrolase family 2 TIM barrel-domain containing protein [Congregicoccus parvus]|uniref:glycoside hydrolase family 2 TIM barrel-domain containing protein n=1 Tax=Congregicoccus parvus TaxID=3081749 RepID=UPI003FA595F3